MMKWLGFFLSEHTTSLQEAKRRMDVTSGLSKVEKLTLLGQLYAARLQGRFVVKQDQTKQTFYGLIMELSPKELTIKTSGGHQLLQVEDILELSMMEEGRIE